MKKYILSVFAILLTLVFSGCFAQLREDTTKAMASWVGHHKSELFQVWGPPQQIHSDGAGGEILVYIENISLGQTPGKVKQDYYGNYTYTTPQQKSYNRSRMFYVNPDGIIYSWKWQGL